MIPVPQRIQSCTEGDCFRACMASLLELPNSDKLPHITAPAWPLLWEKLLNEFGMRLGQNHKAIWREGYWIASVPSLNCPGGSHAIVMENFKVSFDPSLAKTYVTNQDLYDQKIVTFGHWLEVSDVSKLHKLAKYRKKLLKERD